MGGVRGGHAELVHLLGLHRLKYVYCSLDTVRKQLKRHTSEQGRNQLQVKSFCRYLGTVKRPGQEQILCIFGLAVSLTIEGKRTTLIAKKEKIILHVSINPLIVLHTVVQDCIKN